MDGKLNCSLTAENAAFSKIRHLENRVAETEAQLSNVEQQVEQLDGALQDALTDLETNVDTNKVTANIIDVENVDATTVIADRANVLDITATAIDADVIDVDSLEVDALQGNTANVNEVIVAIANVIETNAVTTNSSVTNTETLNVEGETNLTGTTTIDGDIIFTKDNGLSKLEGNYLDIEASNITIENKLDDTRPALLVKNVDSLVEFEGKLKVHNEVEVENLTVNKDAQFSDVTLNNPSFENIADTQRVSTRCLDIDEDGKLIRLNIGEASDAVVTALVATDDNDVERVNISADGAYFNEPVKLNGETTIASETVVDSNVTNAVIENTTTTTLSATNAALDNITMNTLNNKKFYENEWYDFIADNQDKLALFLNNTTIKYPKILLLRDVSTAFMESELYIPVSTIYADIYCPKGTAYTFTVFTSSINKFKGTLTLHNLNVDIRTDEYQRMNSYLSGLKFDSCNITMNMTNYVGNVQDVDIMPLYLYNIVNSTVNFTPATPSDCKWQFSFMGDCKNSVLNSANVEGQSTLLVAFNSAENCTCTAYNVADDFEVTTNSETLNTFVDKDNIIKQVDISTIKAVYDKTNAFDNIIFTKNDLLNLLSTKYTGSGRRQILFINRGVLNLDTADVTADPGTLGYNDVYLANYYRVEISNTGSSTIYFERVLGSVYWHNANIECPLSASTVIDSIRLVDSILTVEEDAAVNSALIYIKNMTNSRCNVKCTVPLTFSMENCDKVKVKLKDITTISTLFISSTYDSVIDVNTDILIPSEILLQYGPGNNMFQVGSSSSTKQIVPFTEKPSQI